jgi:hypothetical protein
MRDVRREGAAAGFLAGLVVLVFFWAALLLIATHPEIFWLLRPAKQVDAPLDTPGAKALVEFPSERWPN